MRRRANAASAPVTPAVLRLVDLQAAAPWARPVRHRALHIVVRVVTVAVIAAEFVAVIAFMFMVG